MPIRFEKHQRTALITIERPETDNAFDLPMSREITEAWIRFRDDPDLWVAVVTGAGDRHSNVDANEAMTARIGAWSRSSHNQP